MLQDLFKDIPLPLQSTAQNRIPPILDGVRALAFESLPPLGHFMPNSSSSLGNIFSSLDTQGSSS
jgi:hypothetical protein